MPEVVVANFNVHGGVDGWGRPFDVVAACDRLAADVLVLEEIFSPDGEQGVADVVAERLDYEVRTVTNARARRYPPAVDAGSGFGPPPWARRPVGVRVQIPRRADGGAWRAGIEGDWGVAILSRLPFASCDDVDLGQLRRDPAHRHAILAVLDAGGVALSVAGVHMSHLTHGSVTQFRRLARALPGPSVNAVVAGDMNLWGWPLRALLPGWRRAVRGRTWPSARPLAQIDHLLVRPHQRVASSDVLPLGASDHRAVRARLSF